MKKVNPKDTKPQPTQETKAELAQDNDILTDEEADKVSGGIVSPRDASTGLATGRRQHKPFIVSTEIH